MTVPSFHLIEGSPSSGRRGIGLTARSPGVPRLPGVRGCPGSIGRELVVAGGVADAVDGADDARTELAAQGLDVGVDRAGAEAVAVAPDVGQELLPGEDHPGLVAEEGQDVELGGGEVDRLAVERGPAGGRLECHPAQPQGPAGGVGGGGRVAGPPDPAEDGVDPGHQLPGAERLGQVVVGADGQADEQVGLRVPGRQHEDGHRPVLLDPAAHLEAVEAGEHQVEDDEVGPDPLDEGHAGRAVGGHLHLEALAAQTGGDGGGDGLLILDDDDSGHTRRIRNRLRRSAQ